MLMQGAIAAMQRLGSAVPISGPLTLTNAAAESGLTGWTVTGSYTARGSGSGFPSPQEGTQYWYPGSMASVAVSELRQTISVPTEAHAAVDAGLQWLEWSAWERNTTTPQTHDLGRLAVECLNAGGTVIATLGPPIHAPQGLAWQQVTWRAALPAGTRSVRFLIQAAAGVLGASRDFYLDNITASWEATGPAALPADQMGFIGLNAETGTLGWTRVIGGFTTHNWVTPFAGSLHFTGADEAATEAHQTVPIRPERIAAVDAGTQQVTLAWRERAWNSGGDEGRMYFEFLDAANVVLGTVGSARTRPPTTWTARSFTGTVPVGTRSVRLIYRADRTGADLSNDYYVDAISATYV